MRIKVLTQRQLQLYTKTMTIIHKDNDNHMNSTQGVPPKGPDNKNENVEKDKYPKRQIVWPTI